MLLTAALLSLLLPAGRSPGAPPGGAPEGSRTAARVELAWFEGSLDEALARAGESGGLVLVELRTDWERECARLRETLDDPVVVEELRDTVCVSLDAESQAGALVAYRYRVARYPTLLFLEPDGELRDRLQGVPTAAQLVPELRRIDRGVGTLRALREALVAAPDDLELRYDLSRRLEAAGDPIGAGLEIEEIRRRDPEGTSRASLRIGFDAIHDAVYDALFKWKEPDWEALERASEEVDDPALRFKGLAMLAYAHDIEGVRARNMRKPDEVQPHLQASRDFYRRALEICPEERLQAFGNELAWNFYEDREHLTDEEKALALEAAQRAFEAGPEDASVLDTLACCHFMNGDVERALELNERCRELDPSRPEQWDRNEALFTGAEAPAAASSSSSGE